MKPTKGKKFNRLAIARAQKKHDAVARAEATAKVAADAPVTPSTKPTAASSVDQVARLESKSAGLGSDSTPATGQAVPVAQTPTPNPTVVPAGANTEAASRTPGPPPAAKPDGPREHGSETMADLVAKHAAANGVPVKLAQAVVRIESRGNVHASNAGALGLMQIKFGTARAAGFSGPAVGLFVADTNLRFGMKILGDAYRAAGGDTCGALMRYQSGHFATHMSRANVLYCSRARAIMAGA